MNATIKDIKEADRIVTESMKAKYFKNKCKNTWIV